MNFFKFGFSTCISYQSKLLKSRTLQNKTIYNFSSVIAFNSPHLSKNSNSCTSNNLNLQSESFLLKPNVLPVISKRNVSDNVLQRFGNAYLSFINSISESDTVHVIMKSLKYCHETLNCPWWITIVISTVGLRLLITFPLYTYQNYVLAKLEQISLEMKGLVEELKMETAWAIKKYNWSETKAKIMFSRSAKRLWNELIIRENCHPFKSSFVVLVQIPLFILVTISYRNLASMMPLEDVAAQITYLELTLGGFGWMPNLTIPDQSWVLPVTMCSFNLLNIELNRLMKMGNGKETKRGKYITIFFRCVTIGVVPIAAFIPSCVTLYWTTSSAFGLMQNLVLLHPPVRRAFRIPKVPSEKEKPYTHLYNKLMVKQKEEST